MFLCKMQFNIFNFQHIYMWFIKVWISFNWYCKCFCKKRKINHLFLQKIVGISQECILILLRSVYFVVNCGHGAYKLCSIIVGKWNWKNLSQMYPQTSTVNHKRGEHWHSKYWIGKSNQNEFVLLQYVKKSKCINNNSRSIFQYTIIW